MSRSAQGGVTISELVVVMGLLGGLMSLVALFMWQGRNYASDTEVYSRVQRSATQALRRITDDLYAGTSNLFQSYGDSAVFLSSRSFEVGDPLVEFHPTTGRVFWRSWVSYYHDLAKETVVRADLPLVTPISEPGETPAPQVGPETFRTQSSVRRLPVAKNVSSFQVVRPGQTVMVRITCRDETPVPQPDPISKPVEVTVYGEVSLIN